MQAAALFAVLSAWGFLAFAGPAPAVADQFSQIPWPLLAIAVAYLLATRRPSNH